MKKGIEKSLSLVIPAHNAAKVLNQSVIEYYQLFSQCMEQLEIIVVCNACTDDTVAIAQELAKTFPLKVLNIPHRGKGNALIRGFNLASYERMGFLDCDNPFSLEKMKQMLQELDKVDIAIASKYLRGSFKHKKGVRDSNLRRIIALGGQCISFTVFGLTFRDTQAGAKFFRKTVWQRLGKTMTCVGFDFDIELLYKAKKHKYSIAEFYTPLVKVEKFSTVRVKYLAGMLYRLFKMRFFG